MKKMNKKLITVSLFLCLACALTACGGGDVDWSDAIYKEDTTLGDGDKTVSVLIVAGENVVNLTLNVNEEVLGDALFNLGLVNDPAFFDTLNGVLASWSKDHAYWAFFVDGQMANYGIDMAIINGGENYKFVYTKQ